MDSFECFDQNWQLLGMPEQYSTASILCLDPSTLSHHIRGGSMAKKMYGFL